LGAWLTQLAVEAVSPLRPGLPLRDAEGEAHERAIEGRHHGGGLEGLQGRDGE
jgi:hypothetical protein